MTQKLKIIFFGTPDFVSPILTTLHQHFNLIAVVTTPDAPIGRKQMITPSPIAQQASQLNIPTLKPQQFSNLTIQQLTEFAPDLFIVASYGKIIPQTILDIPKLGSINIHPSRLPKYRGPSPIQSQILDGVTQSGVTFILMDSEIDHGSILQTTNYELLTTDTFQSLHYSMFQRSADVLPEVISDYIEGKTKPQPQNHTNATFCKHILRESGYFDLEAIPEKEMLNRMIRAYYPWPTAWTRWNGKIVRFLPESKIQIEGKNPVKIKEFLNGYPNFPIKDF